MKTPRTLVAALAAVLALTGCSSTPEPEAAPSAPVESTPAETPSPTPTPSPEPTVETAEHDRGFILKEVGEEAGITNPETGKAMVSFTVVDIQNDYPCEYTNGNENGKFVGLQFSVSVAPEFTADWYGSQFSLPHSWFQVFTADGMRVNDPLGGSASCVPPSDRLPDGMGASQSAEGWLAFDVPEDAEAVAFVIDSAGNGWEWQLP